MTISETAAEPRPGAAHRRKVGLNARQNKAAFIFLAPWIVGMLCLTLGPILASFYLSLTSYDMFTAPEWIGVGNYIKMFAEDRRYFQALQVTFTYVFLSVPPKLASALAIAMFEEARTIYAAASPGGRELLLCDEGLAHARDAGNRLKVAALTSRIDRGDAVLGPPSDLQVGVLIVASEGG